MTEDIFAQQAFGKAAIKKLGAVPENFRLYRAGWMGKHPHYDAMEVAGAEFRVAKRGSNAGKLSIKISGTDRVVQVTREEIRAEMEMSGIEPRYFLAFCKETN